MDLFSESVDMAARVLEVIIQRDQHTKKEAVIGMCHHFNNVMCSNKKENE